MRVVALPKPTEYEKGQWYFQRYINQLPSAGEIVFFDRSWYNRAVVEPTMGFCSKVDYEIFLQQVPPLEKMLFDDGIIIFKFWFSIDIKEQKRRLTERKINPLKQWKLSTIDMEAQRKWHAFTRFKEVMFEKTHKKYCPWIIINGNDKQMARLESMRYLLSQIQYTGKSRKNYLFDINKDILRLYS
jgi:polyphosphate kinase 2